MSRSTHLVCTTCKKHIWIGQSQIIYFGNEEVMELLSSFLQEHTTYSRDEEHKLLFMPEPYNGAYENEDWEEIEVSPIRKEDE